MKYNWWAIKIAIATSIIFVLQIFYQPLTDDLALVSASVLSRPWILITHMFAHASFEHLFFNMFALVFFGSVLEKIIGGKKFLMIYFLSGIIAGFGTLPFYNASIGASGAIFGIIGALGILRPMMPVYVNVAVPLPMIFAVALWAITDFIGIFAPSGVAVIAHLFGLGFGLVYGYFLRKDYPEVKKPQRKTYPFSETEAKEWEDKYMK